MSTPNFSKKNAKDYHCVGINREPEEYIDWDSIREDIQEVAKAENKAWSDTDEWERSYARDYQLHFATERNYEMRYGGERYYAKVMLGLRSAYYEGATIDYNVELSDDFYDGYELEQGDTGSLALSFVEDKYKDGNHSVNKGLATMHRKGLEKKLELWLDSIVADCEKIAQTCAEE